MRYQTFHFYNDIVASIFGYVFTILLIILIKFRSTKELKPYSRMLLINCFLDLLFNTITWIVVFHLEVRDGNVAIWSGGLTKNIEKPFNLVVLAINLFIYGFVLFSLPIAFFYRYFVFTKNIQLSRKKISGLYLISITLSGILALINICAFYPTDENMSAVKYILENKFWEDESGETPKNALYGQLAACPIVTAIIPVFGMNIILASRADKAGVADSMFIAMAWLSTINSLSTILLINPFRKAIMEKINDFQRWLLRKNRVEAIRNEIIESVNTFSRHQMQLQKA